MTEKVKKTIEALIEEFPDKENNLLKGHLSIDEKRGFRGHSVSDKKLAYYGAEYIHDTSFKQQ